MAPDGVISKIRRYPAFRYFGPLVPISEFGASGAQVTDLDPDTRRHLDVMVAYCRDVLTQPNPASGRAGPVCPYSRRAVARDLMFLTHCPLDGAQEESIVQALIGLRAAYLVQDGTLSDEDRLFHSVVITFPHVAERDAPALIERLHERLKPGFTDRGLMFGEFYPSCASAGLHNPDFRPLQTPVAALVIRHMTVRDAPFLLGTFRFRENYMRQFGEEGMRYMRTILDGAAGAGAASLPPHRVDRQILQPS